MTNISQKKTFTSPNETQSFKYEGISGIEEKE